MGGDLVVALGRATVDGHTLFGHNSRRPLRVPLGLHRTAGRGFAMGEKTRTQYLVLPQARQTCSVVGLRPAGVWGYDHGVNEHGVAIGWACLATRLRDNEPGLIGPDLVRLGLERGRSARQAVDVIADLLGRHGQGHPPEEGAGPDACTLLVADGREAFAVETAGRHWVYQEVRVVRALTDVATIRQDWDGISHGLAGWAIAQGFWPDDGSKLDFAGALATEAAPASALRRWGRATLLLEEQNGHLDTAFLRRLLGDHYEGCPDEVDPLEGSERAAPLCLHGQAPWQPATAASLVAHLPADGSPPLVWWGPGPPCTSAFLPVLFDGELPEALSAAGQQFLADEERADCVTARLRCLLAHLGNDRRRWHLAREAFGLLQGRLDQQAEEFVAEAKAAGPGLAAAERQRQAGLFMQHAVEQFEETVDGLLAPRELRGSHSGRLGVSPLAFVADG